MRRECSSLFRRMMVSFVFAALCLISLGNSAVIAAEQSSTSAFKDPYNGGIKLPDGGGEPGNAYMSIIDAAYKKDHAQICKLMSDPADVPQCLQQKDALNGFIAMFTQPKSHAVRGGYMKGAEATLSVSNTFQGAPESTGFVVMKKEKNRWAISSAGGSGSGSVSAEASGKADPGR